MEERKQTCHNCKYYYGTLVSGDETGLKKYYHIHDWCAVWQKQIPASVIYDRMQMLAGLDDIEREISGCWAWEPNYSGGNNERPEEN